MMESDFPKQTMLITLATKTNFCIETVHWGITTAMHSLHLGLTVQQMTKEWSLLPLRNTWNISLFAKCSLIPSQLIITPPGHTLWSIKKQLTKTQVASSHKRCKVFVLTENYMTLQVRQKIFFSIVYHYRSIIYRVVLQARISLFANPLCCFTIIEHAMLFLGQ